MNTELFVSNLPHSLTETGLQNLFAAYGLVTEFKPMQDRARGCPRGFSFVPRATPEVTRHRQ